MVYPFIESGFLWILAAGLGYGIIHSILASHQAKALARTWFNSTGDRYYRLFFNGMAVITLMPVMALVPLLPDQQIYAIPYPMVLLTSVLQAGAAFGLLWAVWQTGALDFLGIRPVFGQPAGEKQVSLVKNGLYRHVRHPIYLFALVFIWLTPVMSWNVLALSISFTAYLFIGAIFEERKLLREFGAEYAEYRSKTPMILPVPVKRG
jgi:methanethiol S-methyltransferase